MKRFSEGVKRIRDEILWGASLKKGGKRRGQARGEGRSNGIRKKKESE